MKEIPRIELGAKAYMLALMLYLDQSGMDADKSSQLSMNVMDLYWSKKEQLELIAEMPAGRITLKKMQMIINSK